MTSLLILIGFLFGVMFVAIPVVAFKRSGWQLNRPFATFSLLFGGIYFLLPCWQMFSGTFRFAHDYSPWSMILSFGYLLLYWAMAFIAFRVLGKKCVLPSSVGALGYKDIFIACGVLLVPGLIAALYLQARLPGIGESGFMANRITLLRGLGAWLLMTYLLYGFITLLAVYLLRQTRFLVKRNILLFVLLALALFVSYRTYYMLGTRQTMMYPILSTMVAASAIGALGRRRLLIGGGVAFVALVAMLYIGATRMYEDSTKVEVNYTEQLANAVGNGELLVWNMENGGRFELLGGGTFAAAFTSFVPRAVMPDKPLGGGPALMNRIFPGSYALYMDNLTSITTGFPVEGFMNFGFAGSILVGLLHGVLLAWLTRAWPAMSRDPFGQALYGILFIGICFALLTNEFLGAFMRTLFVVSFLWGTRALVHTLTRGR